jgi:hypothetical protein
MLRKTILRTGMMAMCFTAALMLVPNDANAGRRARRNCGCESYAYSTCNMCHTAVTCNSCNPAAGATSKMMQSDESQGYTSESEEGQYSTAQRPAPYGSFNDSTRSSPQAGVSTAQPEQSPVPTPPESTP